MLPDELHFGHVRLPEVDKNEPKFIISSGSSGSSENIDGTQMFSMLGVEPHLIEALHRIGISKPADIQVQQSYTKRNTISIVIFDVF